MNQICIRRPNDLQTCLAQSQTKVHVVEIGGKRFIKTVHVLKYFLAHGHARCRHRRVILRQNKSAIQARQRLSGKTMKGMGSNATESSNNPAVLQGAVRKPKARADSAHRIASSMAYHLAQPTSFSCFDIIIQENEDFSLRFLCAAVDQTAEVEFSWNVDNARARFAGQFFQISSGLLFDRTIIDHNNFEG